MILYYLAECWRDWNQSTVQLEAPEEEKEVAPLHR